MKYGRWLLAVALLALTVRGDEFKPAQVPAQAHWLAHLDVARLLASQAGARLLDEIKANPQLTAQLDTIQNTAGVDVRKEVRSLTLFGPDANKNHGVMVLAGPFSTDKLVTAIRANPQHEETTIGNATGHKWVDKGRVNYGCFLPGSVCVFSGYEEAARVTAEVLQSGQGGLTPDSTLGGLAQGAEGSILFAAAEVQGNLPAGQPKIAVLHNAETIQLKVTEKDGQVCAELAIIAVTPEAAQRLADIGRGLIAFGQLSADSEPQVAKLVESAQVKQDGKQVKIQLCCPVDDVVQWIKTHHGQPKAHPAQPASAGGGTT